MRSEIVSRVCSSIANGYDARDNRTSVTDPLGKTTTFTYDAFGRVTQVNFPSNLVESYAYDAVGNSGFGSPVDSTGVRKPDLTSKTDRKNQTINYLYDALDPVISVTAAARSVAGYADVALARMGKTFASPSPLPIENM